MRTLTLLLIPLILISCTAQETIPQAYNWPEELSSEPLFMQCVTDKQLTCSLMSKDWDCPVGDLFQKGDYTCLCTDHCDAEPCPVDYGTVWECTITYA